MNHIFPPLDVGENSVMTIYCIMTRRLLSCDNFLSHNTLTNEDRSLLNSSLSDSEKSFKAVEPMGIKEVINHIYNIKQWI